MISFNELWGYMFTWFDGIVQAMVDIVSFINTPLNQLPISANWLNNLLDYLFGLFAIGGYSLIELMLTVGLPVFITIVVIKFISGLIGIGG